MILNYSPQESVFYFPADPKGLRIPGVTRTSTGYLKFPDTYPLVYQALKTFKALYPTVKAEDEAINRIKKIKEVQSRIDNLELTTKYKHIFEQSGREPYPHQVEDVEKMLNYDNLALLLEQGLGKTYIALMAIMIMREINPKLRTLVLAPRIVLANWRREVEECTTLKSLVYRGDVSKRIEIQETEKDYDILVTNYETLVERTSINSAVLYNWWAKKTEKQRTELIKKHLSEDYLPLATLKDTKKYQLDVGRMIKKMPSRVYMDRTLMDIKRGVSDLNYLVSQNFDVVIIDEGSRVKGAQAKRSQAVKNLAKNIPKRYILSGTLCLGNPLDVYMPMNILNESIFGNNYFSFKAKYTIPSPFNVHIVKEYKNLDDLKKKMDPYIISRKREDTIAMPERILKPMYYEPTSEQVEAYNGLIYEGRKGEDPEDFDMIEVGGKHVIASLIIVKINKLMQILNGFVYSTNISENEICGGCDSLMECVKNKISFGDKKCFYSGQTTEAELIPLEYNTAKLDLLKEDLNDLIEQEKVIIWANYRYDIENILGLLDKSKIKYVTASNPDCESIFQKDTNTRVFVVQTKQGIGITLNEATTTIYYSHTMDLEARLQSLDRNYRIGQKKPVVVKDYMCEGSIEEDIVNLLRKKENVKDILQHKPQCAFCKKYGKCTAELYGPACIYYERIKYAERKKGIILTRI